VITEARRFEVSLFAETEGNCFNGSALSNAKEGTAAGGVCAAGGFGNIGDVGGNLTPYSSTRLCSSYSPPSCSARVAVSGQGLH
jgi:hypothetical protein